MDKFKASLEQPRPQGRGIDVQRRDLLPEKELEAAIEQQVFADLRQMMLIPALHTEYRRFIVLRERDQTSEKDGIYNATKDSVRYRLFSFSIDPDIFEDPTLIPQRAYTFRPTFL
jgi:hypothetical protein